VGRGRCWVSGVGVQQSADGGGDGVDWVSNRMYTVYICILLHQMVVKRLEKLKTLLMQRIGRYSHVCYFLQNRTRFSIATLLEGHDLH
jgi:hypothetical protein